MKKFKNGKVLILFSTVFLLVAMLTVVCFTDFSKKQNLVIENGLASYEIAAQYGYNGTVVDWIADIGEEDAYIVATSNGFIGSEADWDELIEKSYIGEGVDIKAADFCKEEQLLISLSDNTILNVGDTSDSAENGVKAVDVNDMGQLILTLSSNQTVNMGRLVGVNSNDGKTITESNVSDDGVLTVGFSNGTSKVYEFVPGDLDNDGECNTTDLAVLKMHLAGQMDLETPDIPMQGTNNLESVEINEDGELVVVFNDGSSQIIGKVKGDDGIDGVGISNILIVDGNLNITLSNGTKLDLGKIKGENGKDGRGISNISLTDDELIITLTDNSRVNLGNVRGKDGRGISDIKIENGELKVKFTDSDVYQNLGNVKGEDGKTPYIKDGNWWIGESDTGIKAQGNDGVSVVNSYVDESLHLWIVLSNGTKIDAGYVGVTSNSPTPTKFTVVFKDYDNTVLKTEDVEHGKAATAPIEPAREGYLFAGWDKSFDNVTKNMVVTATYTVVSEPIIKISNVTTVKGTKNVAVTVNVMNNPGIVGMTLKLNYDENVVTLTSIEQGEALKEMTFTKPRTMKNGCVLQWDAEMVLPENATNGVMLTLYFDVSQNATLGDYDIALSYDNGAIIDNDLLPVIMSVINGNITVK